MSRVLHGPTLDGDPRIVAVVAPAVDPVVQTAIDQLVEDAYQQGYRAGRDAGRRDGRQEVGHLAATLDSALAATAAAVSAMRADQAAGVVELATAIAAHVLDREPGDEGRATLARIEAWLAEIDDGPVEIAVSPADAGTIAAALAGRGDVEVRVESALGQGEARLSGRWAHAELTRSARWADALEALDER